MKPMGFKSAAALVRWVEASMRRMARCRVCRGRGVIIAGGLFGPHTEAHECAGCEGLGVVIT